MTRCPACGRGTEPWLTAPGGEPTDRTSYSLVRCRNCGTAVTAGDAPDSSAYVTGIYSPRAPRLAVLVRAVQRLAQRLPLRLLRQAGIEPGAAVLDAGAGRGRLAAELRRRGYSADGIDPAPRGENVQRAAIDEHRAEHLDAVVLWHVLEHVRDPGAALARVRGWLRPGGVVVVAVPNMDSWQSRIAGPRWFHLDLPRHRTHFTTAGLGRLLERSGLAPAQTHHFVAEHNLHGMWFALLARLGMTPGFPFHLLKRSARASGRNVALLLLAGPPLLPVAIALELVAAALRRGGTIAAVARAQPEP